MATINTVTKSLVQILKPALAGLIVDGDSINVKIARGWPSLDAIQQCGQQKIALVGVTDEGVGNGTSSNWPRDLGTINTPAGILSTLSAPTLLPGDSCTLTLALANGFSAVQVNDAYALNVDNYPVRYGADARAVQGETLSSLATKLMVCIRNTDGLKDLLTVVQTGAVLTLTNVSTNSLALGTAFSNIGTLYRETGRGISTIHIVIWAGTEVIRDAVGDIVEGLIASFRDDAGFAVQPFGDALVSGFKAISPSDKDTIADAFRRDFLFPVNYAELRTITVYPVLVNIGRPVSEF